MDISLLSTIRNFSKGWTNAAGQPAEPLSVWEYLGFAHGLHDAAAFGTLFWPEFQIHEGLVFLCERFSLKSFENFVTAGSTPFEAAMVVNHVHVFDLFGFREEQVSIDVANYVADVLRDSWSAKLAAEIDEDVVGVVIDPGPDDPQVIIRQTEFVGGD